MKTKKILQGIVAAGVLSSSALCVFAPTNFFAPYDPNLRLPDCPDTNYHFGVNVEWGKTHDCENWDGDKKNVLKIYNDYEDVALMFKHPAPKNKDQIVAACNDLYSAFGGQLTTAPVGFTGEFSQWDITPFGKYTFNDFIKGKLGISFFVPIRNAEISDVKFEDLSNQYLPVIPKYFKQNYTENFDTFRDKITSLGGPELKSWSKTGVGDCVLMLDWIRSFRQNKESLKNVDFILKLGVSIPSAEKKNTDDAFSMSLGNDGAWGIPLGAGLALDFEHNIRLGGDVEFFVLLNETHERRLKTDYNQTEILLLNKGDATLDHGLTWKFNLFLQGYRLFDGLSLKFAYEYIKHDSDKLYEKTDSFNHSIINSANSLREWNTHNLIFQVNLDIFKWWKVISKPQVSLFYKLPVSGKNVFNSDNVGGQVGFNF